MPLKMDKNTAIRFFTVLVHQYYVDPNASFFEDGINEAGEYWTVEDTMNDGEGFNVCRFESYDEEDGGVDEIDGGQVTDLRWDEDEGMDESMEFPSDASIRSQAEFIAELCGY